MRILGKPTHSEFDKQLLKKKYDDIEIMAVSDINEWINSQEENIQYTNMNKIKVLELFKGTGSITKYYEGTDVEVISLDILERFNPTILCDIIEFDYKKYPIGYFDIIWASPECKVYSSMNIMNIGENQKYKSKEDLISKQKEDSKFINRTIEIIEYLKPKNYFIENPLNSAIWKYIDNEEFKSKFIIVDYCYFGYDYKKPTKILTDKNIDNKRCGCKKHEKVVCWTNKKDRRPHHNQLLDQKYSIPQNLLKYLLSVSEIS